MPAPAGIVIVAVVVVLDDSPPISTVGAVRSWAWQVQPFSAVEPVAPAMVMATEVQGPAARVKIPALAPPVVVPTVQPVPAAVNLVPVLEIGTDIEARVADHEPQMVLPQENPRTFAEGR